ncbi:chaperonin 10-like protein [Aspergillus alliaceus]|uniref:chaperonin 10-like protein n=1 Tax=Petromyces alliaceus TaxID=209559 RepID=UPI0012A60D7A|nr:chaperonin 10-like protein [Aspergillus alliaceus]KAB8234306.1 chaperonin 10-like protein [Aspergillus alliaceus]
MGVSNNLLYNNDKSNPSFVLRTILDLAFKTTLSPPSKTPRDVHIHIAQTGISRIDIYYRQRGEIGGHESPGMVVEVGPAVDNLKVGDRVAIEPGVPCRRCHHCRVGLHNLCRDIVSAATPLHDGMLFKYYTTQSVFCYPIPSQMSFEEGALVEPLAVAMQVAKAVGTVCKAYGAKKVVRVSLSLRQLEVAMAFGADEMHIYALPPDQEDGPKWSNIAAHMIRWECKLEEAPGVVVEATGSRRREGHMCKLGWERSVQNVVFPITTACVWAGCFSAILDLIASGKIDVKRLVAIRFAFEQVEEAFELLSREDKEVEGQGDGEVINVMIAGRKD